MRVIELQPTCGHEVDEQHKRAGELDDEVLAATTHTLDSLAPDRRERRVKGLERVDAGRERRLDLCPAQRVVEQACGDLDLGQLGHLIATLGAPGAVPKR